MRKHSKLSRMLSGLLVLLMVAGTLLVTPTAAFAAQGEADAARDALTAPAYSIGDNKISLPETVDGREGSTVTWESNTENVIWNDGTVLRPTTGVDAKVTLTATVTLDGFSATKDFIYTVESYVPALRSIVGVYASPDTVDQDIAIDVPKGSAPKLPWRVWVVYNDGFEEWRSTKWPWQAGDPRGTHPNNILNGPPADGDWTPSNVEDEWKGYEVGADYEVIGWVTGQGANTLGFPFSVKCKVVDENAWREENVPSNKVVADQLPPGKVKLTGENRLTSDATRSIARTLTYSPDTYLWNYRDTFGVEQPANVQKANYNGSYIALQEGETIRAPGGWENAVTRLRGHGVGHYMSSLALAYASGLATDEQQTQLRDNMIYMINEMRELQEMTFYKVPADHPSSIENGGSGYREGSNVWPYYPADKAELAPDWKWPLLSEVSAEPPATFNHIAGNYWAEDQIQADGKPLPSVGGPNRVVPAGEAYGAAAPDAEGYMKSEKGEPEWFGYGYLNAIPPLHPAMNEAYRGYSAWLWAPYYGIHKQLAGRMEIYYVFKDSEDAEEKATSDKALKICTDMSHWISDRLTKKAEVRDDTSTAYYGNMRYTWSTNISGEYGGANESIARCAFELGDQDPNKELLIDGSEMFNNKSYWEPLVNNTEIMSLAGNSHANSRIPNFPGVLWSYRGNADEDFYLMAKNDFDFNVGRYQYYNGGVGIGEWYRTPYTQIAQIPSEGGGAETCCSYNLARLAKDLACFDPDNSEYMDQYERLFYNHLVGSLAQNKANNAADDPNAEAQWNNTYHFFLGPGSNSDYGRGQTPGQSCCGGTSAETHVRYADATYLVSTDEADPTIWVNLYMPTEVTWDAAGVLVKQDSLWPSERSVFTVEQLPGATAKTFTMKLRVPSWATGAFDIKVDGASIAESYKPGSYVAISSVTVGTKIEVDMDFVTRLDYAPDKRDDNWVATVFHGPMAMGFPGTSAREWPGVLNVEGDMSNITENAIENLDNTAVNTPGNNTNLYSLSIPDQSTEGNFAGTLLPSYYITSTSTQPRPTHYFMVNLVPAGLDRATLGEEINGARGILPGNYTEASFEALQGAIADGVSIYQRDDITQDDIDARIAAVNSAEDNLVPTQAAKAELLASITTANDAKAATDAWEAAHGDAFAAAWSALLNDLGNETLQLAVRALVDQPNTRPYAPRGYARMLEKFTPAQNVYDNEASTVVEVSDAMAALSEAIAGMRPGYQPEAEDVDPPDGLVYGMPLASLVDLTEEAKTYNPSIYTKASYSALENAIANAEEDVVPAITGSGSSTIHIGLIPDAIAQLNAAIAGLTVDYELPAPEITTMSLGTAEGWVAKDFDTRARVVATTVTNEPLTYSWSMEPAIEGNTIVNENTNAPTFKFANFGLYAVTVNVTDSLDRTTTKTMNIAVSTGTGGKVVDLNRDAVYGADEGNIARLDEPDVTRLSDANNYYTAGQPGDGIVQSGLNAQYSNAGGRNGILRINDGQKNTSASGSWNNWGSAFGVESNPVYIVLNWGETVTVDSMRAEFSNDGGATAGTQTPRQAFVEYWDGAEWMSVTDARRPDGDNPDVAAIATTGDEAGNFVNDAGGDPSSPAGIDLSTRPNWNKIVFDKPITASMVRLRLTQRQTANNNNGIGVSEWEVFGTLGIPTAPPKSDKTALLNAILEFEALNPADYTPNAYNAAKAAYDAAMLVFVDGQESMSDGDAQEAADTLAGSLGDAILALTSNDATLSTLTTSEGILTPAFAADTTEYTVSVPSSIAGITIAATPNVSVATVEGTGEKELDYGLNTFNVTVTAADGETVKTYTLAVTRAQLPAPGGGGASTGPAPTASPEASPAATPAPGTTPAPTSTTGIEDGEDATEGTQNELAGVADIAAADGGEVTEEDDGTVVINGGATIATNNGAEIDVPDGTRISADGLIVSLPRGGASARIRVGDELFDVEQGMSIELVDDGVALGGVNIFWENPFDDVQEENWFIDDVSYVYRSAIMDGTSSDPMLFSPGVETTRGMIVTVLYRMEGSPDVSGLENPFDDVADAEWYADAVKWAVSEGIVQGYGESEYGPGDSVTREQLVSILARYMNYKEIVLAVTQQFVMFADEADISDYAKEAIQTMHKLGVINGIGANTIAPKANATRAEFAAMLNRFNSLET